MIFGSLTCLYRVQSMRLMNFTHVLANFTHVHTRILHVRMLIITQYDPRFVYVSQSLQKDFGAKGLNSSGRRRGINSGAFSSYSIMLPIYCGVPDPPCLSKMVSCRPNVLLISVKASRTVSCQRRGGGFYWRPCLPGQ